MGQLPNAPPSRTLTSMIRRFVLISCLIAGCATQAPSYVTGTASYLERMALPPGAVFEATLEDVSRAGKPQR